jgi:hypothetical protein
MLFILRRARDCLVLAEDISMLCVSIVQHRVDMLFITIVLGTTA